MQLNTVADWTLPPPPTAGVFFQSDRLESLDSNLAYIGWSNNTVSTLNGEVIHGPFEGAGAPDAISRMFSASDLPDDESSKLYGMTISFQFYSFGY